MGISQTIEKIAERYKIEEGIILEDEGKIKQQLIERYKTEDKTILAERHAKELVLLKKLNLNHQHKMNPVVFHYTTLDGLHSIFNDYIARSSDAREDVNGCVKKCTMRASEIKFLNDKEEYTDGVKIYQKFKDKALKCVNDAGLIKNNEKNFEKFINNWYIEKTVDMGTFNTKEDDILPLPSIDTFSGDTVTHNENTEICEDCYCICFCKDGDLKSQWQGYSKAKGVTSSGIAIGFNLNNIAFINPKNRTDTNAIPLPVCYTEEEKLEFYIRCCTKFSSATACSFGVPDKNYFVPYCKHVSFQEEKEIRLLFYRQQNTGNSKNPDTFDVKYPNLKPTIEIDFELKDPLVGAENNIISEIIVGPGPNQNLIFNHLIHIFDKRNFKFIEENENSRLFTEPYVCNGDLLQHLTFKCQNGVKIKKSCSPFRDE